MHNDNDDNNRKMGGPSLSPPSDIARCATSFDNANDPSTQDFSLHFRQSKNDGCTDLAVYKSKKVVPPPPPPGPPPPVIKKVNAGKGGSGRAKSKKAAVVPPPPPPPPPGPPPAVYKSATNDTEEDAPRDEDDPWSFGGYIDTTGGSKSRSWNCNKPLLFVISGLALIIVTVSSGIAAARHNDRNGMANGANSLDSDSSTTAPTLQPTLRPTRSKAITTTSPTTRDSAAIATNRAHVQRTSRNITADGFGDVDKLQLTMKQISFGAHTLFGYIGQSLTIPWSGDDRYIVALESSFHDHLPLAHEAARIILIDTLKGYITEYVDETRAWNLQQGTMLYWNPHSPNTQFFFNDRDPQTNQVFTVLFDITSKSRVKEYRFDDGISIGNGGVCPEGGFFFALNYAR